MKKKVKYLLEVLLYVFLYIGFSSIVILFILNFSHRPIPTTEEGWIGVISAFASTIVAIAALQQAKTSNKINILLAKIEEQRDQYDLRPFLMVGKSEA